MQVRHYKTNQNILLKISEEMDLFIDEEIALKKFENQIKKKTIQNDASNKNVLDIFDLIAEEEYEDPFEKVDDEFI